ncbi:MAG: aspartate aminotransferase family protein [Verrucomicrobia bacterium]|jgi:4-aminobutyrate aminotransferase-like enzyme|nr:aspartate aminotransferase family protein [Verrucomicrobiota bacterium]
MTTLQTLDLLRAYESRNVTFMEADGSWPIVWERARGVHVWDADGKKYLDLTAAFGVAACGHANPKVVRAGQTQLAKLLHAMGDVHPHGLKARLARELSRITFERWNKTLKRPSVEALTLSPIQRFNDSIIQRAKTIFCNSGFEAVEAALKTAMLATGKPGVIAFEGAYHGLGYGVLNTTHRDHFREPFRLQLGEFGHFVPFPGAGQASRLSPFHGKNVRDRRDACPTLRAIETCVQSLLRREKIGAILVEPIQARGGINIPSPGFLPLLRRLCDEHKVLLILDEIYTGFGRTGKWFACEHSGVVPDLICLGKALTGGFPLSACVGRAGVMDAAWPPSSGEAIHTSTFLGHPVGCVMALAQIVELQRLKLIGRSARLGEFLREQLQSAIGNLSRPCASTAGRQLAMSVRGVGLMAGLELRKPDGSPATEEALRAIKAMLPRGYILLPEGEHSNVISFTPPLTITETQLAATVNELKNILITDGHG